MGSLPTPTRYWLVRQESGGSGEIKPFNFYYACFSFRRFVEAKTQIINLKGFIE